MDDEKWPPTWRAIEESERASQGDSDLTDETKPDHGNSLLQELVAEGVVEEVTPGRYWASKLRPDRDKLS